MGILAATVKSGEVPVSGSSGRVPCRAELARGKSELAEAYFDEGSGGR
jgi:hypothetical protein